MQGGSVQRFRLSYVLKINGRGPTRLVSAATSRSELPAQWSVEFVNQPGIIGLYRPYADGGVLGLQENSLLKLVPDKDRLRGWQPRG
eukprot:Skav234614  [mRNA]  locus=scaffold1110:504432:508489:- [translate_table: standard]